MAKILVRWFISIFLVHFCVAVITTIQETNFATTGQAVTQFSAEGPSLSAAADKYIFCHDITDSSRVLVFERDAQGNYSTYYTTSWPRTPAFVTTNGKWFGSLGSGFVNSFRLGANGTFDNMTEFNTLALSMQFLSDDTLVLINNTIIETYEFTTDQWTLIQSQPVNFTVIVFFTRIGEPADSTPHVTDTTLAAYNPRGAVELYTRNADKSWTLVDEISIDTTQYRANRILWNGDDTVVLGDTTYTNNGIKGRILIYTKVDGSWTLTSVINGSSLGITGGYGFFAYSMLMVDRNTIAIGAPNQYSYRGQVFLLRRSSDGTWQITTQIIGRDTRFYFGNTLMKTNYELVIHTGDTSTIPQHVAISGCRLPTSPTYTCNDIVLDTCSEVIDFPFDHMYTANELGQCTTANLRSFRFDGQSATFTLGLTRNSETFYCNSTITCPGPPMDTPVTTPLANSPVTSSPETTPRSVPVSSNIPVASHVPGTPNPSSQTSGATDLKWRIVPSSSFLFIVIYGLLNTIM